MNLGSNEDSVLHINKKATEESSKERNQLDFYMQ